MDEVSTSVRVSSQQRNTQAAIAMGLPPSTMKDVDNLERRFSDDVLSITLSGPEHQHLSIVDVPGLFHSE
jgi:hypothetical protein